MGAETEPGTLRPYLFVGGPCHGEERPAEGAALYIVEVPVRGESGWNPLAAVLPQPARHEYLLRRVSVATGERRSLYVHAALDASQARYQLADLLITRWVLDAPDPFNPEGD